MKKRLIGLLTLLTIGLLIGGAIYILFLLLAAEKFDQERWISKPTERVEMVDNLFSEVGLNRMSKAEIASLLGEQEEEVYFKEQNNLVYYLGDERGLFSIDSEWLVIWFDNKNKVMDYEIKID